MQRFVALLTVAALSMTPALQAVSAEIEEGEVEEITITIKTDDGSKTFTVDDDVDLDDVAVGTKIKFVPVEDKIDMLEVMEDE